MNVLDMTLNNMMVKFCWELVLTASNCNNWLQTNWTSCRTGSYHCLSSTCFLWASYLHPIQPVHSQGYTLISSTGCTFSLIDGWVGGQYVTNWSSFENNECSRLIFNGTINLWYICCFECCLWLREMFEIMLKTTMNSFVS